MTHGRWLWLAVAFGVLVAAMLTGGELIEWAQHSGFDAYCRGQHYPDVWRVQGQPSWATPTRMDLACALAAWVRAEFSIALREE